MGRVEGPVIPGPATGVADPGGKVGKEHDVSRATAHPAIRIPARPPTKLTPTFSLEPCPILAAPKRRTPFLAVPSDDVPTYRAVGGLLWHEIRFHGKAGLGKIEPSTRRLFISQTSLGLACRQSNVLEPWGHRTIVCMRRHVRGDAVRRTRNRDRRDISCRDSGPGWSRILCLRIPYRLDPIEASRTSRSAPPPPARPRRPWDHAQAGAIGSRPSARCHRRTDIGNHDRSSSPR